MEVTFIVLLIVIGLALLIVEVVVLPGVTVAGIGGLILIGCSVFLTFVLRAKTWDKLSLHSEIDGKVNVVDTNDIKTGDRGMTVSRLAPIGKIIIHDKIMEGKSEFGLIDENKEVEVVFINESTIVVQEIKSSL